MLWPCSEPNAFNSTTLSTNLTLNIIFSRLTHFSIVLQSAKRKVALPWLVISFSLHNSSTPVQDIFVFLGHIFFSHMQLLQGSVVNAIMSIKFSRSSSSSIPLILNLFSSFCMSFIIVHILTRSSLARSTLENYTSVQYSPSSSSHSCDSWGFTHLSTNSFPGEGLELHWSWSYIE